MLNSTFVGYTTLLLCPSYTLYVISIQAIAYNMYYILKEPSIHLQYVYIHLYGSHACQAYMYMLQMGTEMRYLAASECTTISIAIESSVNDLKDLSCL